MKSLDPQIITTEQATRYVKFNLIIMQHPSNLFDIVSFYEYKTFCEKDNLWIDGTPWNGIMLCMRYRKLNIY